MERHPVNSTFAKAIGYDHSQLILEIETHPSRTAPGHIYQYKGITPRKFASFVMSNSIGKYYNRKIKGKFEHQEVFEQHEAETSTDTIKEIAVAVVNEMALRIVTSESIDRNVGQIADRVIEKAIDKIKSAMILFGFNLTNFFS